MSNISAEVESEIVSDGGSVVTESGLCWNTEGMPVIDDNRISGNIGFGKYSHNLNGLKANTKYYVRAYAQNSGRYSLWE